MNKKKFYLKFLLYLGILFIVTNAFAIPKGPCDQPKDVCCDEPPVGPFAFSYPKDVGLSCPRDFYAHGEFLWMKPTEEGLEYVIKQYGEVFFPLKNERTKNFSWNWKPGFRAGLGFYNNFDSWNIDVNWTYLRIKTDSSVVFNIPDSDIWLLAFFLTPTGSLLIQHASSRWSGDLNTLDLMLGKSYHVSRYFTSNPMLGIQAAWIDQDYHIRYFILEDRVKHNVWHKNDYWAIGLRVAYKGDFLLGSGWFIYGKAAFALLFGKFNTSQYSHDDYINEELFDFYKYKIKDSFYNVKPNAELGLGLSWSKFFHKNRYKIALKVGYEFHQWWNQNQIRRFFSDNPVANDTVSRGDFSFSGFMFGLNIDF